VLQPGLPGAGGVPDNIAAGGGTGKARAKFAGAEPKLQFPRGCASAGGPREAAETDDHWIAAEEHKTADPASTTPPRAGDA